MPAPELEPATTAWDEYKPLAGPPPADRRTVGAYLLWVLTLLPTAAMAALLIAPLMGMNNSDLGVATWLGSGISGLLMLPVTFVYVLVNRKRHEANFRAGCLALALAGFNLLAFAALTVYELSTLSFC